MIELPNLILFITAGVMLIAVGRGAGLVGKAVG